MGCDEVIVLDTHIFYWYLTDDDRLDKALLRIIRDPANTLAISAVTLWELLLLDQKGRIGIGGNDKGAELRRLMGLANVREVSLNGEMAVLSRTLAFQHEDPADRFIAATAYALGATLATQDEHMRQLPWITLTV